MHPRLRLPAPDSRAKVAVVAIDPGPGTGIATYHPYPAVEGMHFDSQNLDLGKEGHVHLQHYLEDLGNQLHYFLRDMGPGMIPLACEGVIMVLEPFEFRKKDSEERAKIDYMAAEYVGVAKLVANRPESHYDQLVLQNAATGKGFWDDAKIRNIFCNGHFFGTRHERDAMRHLLKYLSFNMQQKWLFDALRPVLR